MATKDRNQKRIDALKAQRDEHAYNAKQALKTLVAGSVHPSALEGLLDQVIDETILAASASIAADLIKAD